MYCSGEAGKHRNWLLNGYGVFFSDNESILEQNRGSDYKHCECTKYQGITYYEVVNMLHEFHLKFSKRIIYYRIIVYRDNAININVFKCIF